MKTLQVTQNRMEVQHNAVLDEVRGINLSVNGRIDANTVAIENAAVVTGAAFTAIDVRFSAIEAKIAKPSIPESSWWGPSPSAAASNPGASSAALVANAGNVTAGSRPWQPPSDIDPLLLVLKNVGRSLTSTMWKEVWAKLLGEMHFDDEKLKTIKPLPRNERTALNIRFETKEVLNEFLTRFNETKFEWLDDHNGSTHKPRLHRDTPLRVRQAKAKFNYLYGPASTLLEGCPKYKKDIHKIGISGYSDFLFVTDGRDQWVLFRRKDGVVTPDYDDCALLGISPERADAFLEQHPPPA
jgi:hypothetical protein